MYFTFDPNLLTSKYLVVVILYDLDSGDVWSPRFLTNRDEMDECVHIESN